MKKKLTISELLAIHENKIERLKNAAALSYRGIKSDLDDLAHGLMSHHALLLDNRAAHYALLDVIEAVRPKPDELGGKAVSCLDLFESRKLDHLRAELLDLDKDDPELAALLQDRIDKALKSLGHKELYEE